MSYRVYLCQRLLNILPMENYRLAPIYIYPAHKSKAKLLP